MKTPYANELTVYRRRMSLSQKSVARLLGHRDSTLLSTYERGQALPPLLTALRLGIILRVPVEFLFGGLYDSLRTAVREAESAEPEGRGP